ncbi:maleylpyruvate isomerase family mycothiol-dependent enzyme [Streptomyces sp. SBT349]|uniref:maleylpyruvate isomerase family mycothiol-dependent enzyme n=1 Tax=Streptomyces sp. SBT349 TaxID=1580539 RepID=UPI00066D7FF6|nr:maleylpyruvate isomerase family mycothiol-dependent enzyme [Streptomyces sp. SBT349]
MDWTWLGPPKDVRPLFPVERAALLDLLRGLDAADWSRPTACPEWEVQDLVGHILHGYVRRLSAGRDHHPGPAFAPGESLPDFLTRANGSFVRTVRQLSPRLKTDLLDHLGGQLDEFWAAVDMSAPAALDVSWAAPGEASPAWLDVAREYTEFWVHQQQIRDAAGRPGADEPRLVRSVLDAFLRALPHTLRGTAAPPGTAVRVTVPGPAGGHWTAVRMTDRWALTTADAADAAPGSDADAEVTIDADTLWRVATHGIEPETAATRATQSGDPALAAAVLRIVSIVR